MDFFSTPARTWFDEAFPGPTPVQERGWAAIAGGAHTLLAAPTGSGKTLAAFLWGIDQATRLEADAPAGVRILYLSPLKALVHDVERNLRGPLAGVVRTAEKLGLGLRRLQVDVRTGDTPQRERQRMARHPGEILVTTPESLYLILGSQARAMLATVQTVIVDEIHALAPTKRGAHLALSLERLSLLTEAEPQRIGLSATARPLDEVGRFLAGGRGCEVIDASQRPDLDLLIDVPAPDMENVAAPPPSSAPSSAPSTGEAEGGPILGEIYRYPNGAPSKERGIWPVVYPELVERIRSHHSTIVFVNSRGLCERLVQRLNEEAGEELAWAHHGSVSHERRATIEEGLKRGSIRAIVATSSLELGIDMGAVDLVILVESPGSVARGLQRVGRAGHKVGDTSRGRVFPKFRGDLLECAVVVQGMLEGAIEPVRVPRNPLDVLSQQIVAAVCDAPCTVGELEAWVRRAHPFHDLPATALAAVLDMLSGRFPSTDFADLRPRLSWDRTRDLLEPRRGAPMVARLGAGTIPDRGTYGVYVAGGGPRIGELDEEMVFETREGDTFLLGTSTWRVEEMTKDRLIVTPAPGEPGRLPFWHGDGPGRPIELGRALGVFVRELGAVKSTEAEAWLRERLPLSEYAARNLVRYVEEQREATGSLPTDRSITIERFRDELGDWRVCLLSPFGSRVHAPWALALERRLVERGMGDPQLLYSDDGIVLRFADGDDLPDADLLLPDPEEVEELVTGAVSGSSLFASLFRENAVRSLLISRRRPEQRSPLWAQRLKARNLLSAVEPYPDFPIVLETYRQAMADVFDLEALREVLGGIRSRTVRVHEVETPSASPFARSLVFAYVAQYLYDQDAPVAERKAQALTLDRGLLSELLGHAELRELLDAEAIAEVEAELQRRVEGRRARDADELHDLLRSLGALLFEEVGLRCEGTPAPWLESLEAAGRAVRVRIAGEERWIAAEETGLYRDGLGCMPPGGVAAAFLEEVPDAPRQLIRRHARTHGPFPAASLAAELGLTVPQVMPVLRELEREDELVRGELRPGGTEIEWCSREVLRRIKRRTLARLRGELAAVDAAAFARFLPRWQGIGSTSQNSDRLDEVLEQLEGLALPWSVLAQEVLPARIASFSPQLLDLACAQGKVVWIGRGARGTRDGDVALYRRGQAATWAMDGEPYEAPGEPHRLVLEHLAARGASFLFELEGAVQSVVDRLSAKEFEAVLWDLVWSGQITNDTFQPLRSLAGSRRSRRGGDALAGGRWSLVTDLLRGEVASTEAVLTRANTLLTRYGIVTREAAASESIPGGFGPLYKVFAAMEETGKIRRGWFVEGLGGAQFALAGAIDRLRDPEGEGSKDVDVLPVLDPAQAYGSLLPWPETAGTTRPRRVPGAYLHSVAGRPALLLPPGRRELVTFTGEGACDAEGLSLALHHLARHPRPGGGKLLVVERVDGVDVLDSPLLSLLLDSGFVRDYRGLTPDLRIHA